MWRDDNEIDTVLERPCRNFGIIKRFYPHYYCGYGKTGNICYYEECGRIDVPSLLENGVDVKDLVDYYVFMTEFCFSRLLHSDGGKCITIFDVKGVAVTDLQGIVLAFIKASSKIMQDHYPEKSQCILVINAPIWFTAIWTVVRALINERTQEKVRILSPGDSYKGLSEFIAPESIPVKYGGLLEFKKPGEEDDCRFWSEEEVKLRKYVRGRRWAKEKEVEMMVDDGGLEEAERDETRRGGRLNGEQLGI